MRTLAKRAVDPNLQAFELQQSVFAKQFLELRHNSVKVTPKAHFSMQPAIHVGRVSGLFSSFDPEGSSCVITNTWMFRPHRTLSFNITFLTVNFSLKFVNCHFAKLNINSTNWNELRYCGTQSKFQVFADFVKFDIHLEITAYILHHVNAFFTVLDKHLIGTFDGSVHTSENIGFCSFLKLNNKSEVLFYLIQSDKTTFITVTVANWTFHKVLDGPGLESDDIRPFKNAHSSSTFQCVVLLLAQMLKGTDLSKLDFLSQEVKTFKTINVTTKEIVELGIPNEFCSKPCVIKLRLEPGFQLNVTVNNMVYKGIDNAVCLYGGLVLLEKLTLENKQIASLCKTHNEDVTRPKNYYSINSSVVIVLFWYKHYSSVSSSIQISHTKCKPVEICDCSLALYCEHPENYDCKNYLNYVSRYTEVNFTSQSRGTCDTDKYNDLLFSLPDGECITLHIFRNFSLYPQLQRSKILRCKIQLASAKDDLLAKQIHFKIFGNLNFPSVERYKFQKCSIYNIDSKKHWLKPGYSSRCPSSHYELDFQDKFSLGEEGDSTEKKTNTLNIHSVHQSSSASSGVSIQTQSATRKNPHCFHIKIERLTLTTSWVDITIFKSQLDSQINETESKQFSVCSFQVMNLQCAKWCFSDIVHKHISGFVRCQLRRTKVRCHQVSFCLLRSRGLSFKTTTEKKNTQVPCGWSFQKTNLQACLSFKSWEQTGTRCTG